MAYLGSTPTTQSFISGTDAFNGTGSATNFTLSRFVNSVNDVQVVVNNVVQYPPNYSVSGNTLTISPAPSAGTNNVYVRYLSTTLQSIAPSQGSSIQFGTGSLALPSISFIGDTNTGIYSPAADTIAFVEGGTEAMRIDSSANVGIGTSSPTDSSFFTRALDLNGTSGAAYYARTNGSTTNYTLFGNFGADGYINNRGAGTFQFFNNNLERARINSSGNLLVGTTSTTFNEKFSVAAGGSGINTAVFTFTTTDDRDVVIIRHVRASGGTNAGMINFLNASGSTVGLIYSNGSNTVYATSSDYRLKENIQPMTGALARVAALQPCTYVWKEGGEIGEGFIAHELQAVCPSAVAGEKDAVNEDGSIKPQGIDTSFLVATLTAAIQELKAEVDALRAQVEAK